MHLCLSVLLGLSCLLVACSKKDTTAADGATFEELLGDGENVYNETCALCHLDGRGSDIVPPLAAAPAVMDQDPSAMIRILLRGQQGPLERQGRKFNGIMPPMAYLSDKEIAAVATYVRKVHADANDPVTPALVKKLR